MKQNIDKEWISVELELPKVFGKYKIRTESGDITECFYVRNASGRLFWVIPDYTIITHWMNYKP